MQFQTVENMLARNSKFSETFKAPPKLEVTPGKVPGPSPGVILISCSDPRLNHFQIFGLDSTIRLTPILNAGGRAMDAIRSISDLQTIGNAGTIVVMHHTDCGMTHISDANVRAALTEIAPQEAETIKNSKYGEIKTDHGIEPSIEEDVEILRSSPFVQPGTRIVGLLYDITKGVATKVKEAEAGA